MTSHSKIGMVVCQGTGSYGKTDMMLLSRLLDEIQAGDFDAEMQRMNKEKFRMLLERCGDLSKDIVEFLYGDRFTTVEQPVRQSVKSDRFLTDRVESYHRMYDGTNRFAAWARNLPLDFCTKLSDINKRILTDTAAWRNERFRTNSEEMIYLDILLPSLINQASFAREQAFNKIAKLLADPNFPAYASSEMLNCGRCIIAPTADALNRMAEFEAFRLGDFGFCKARQGGSEWPAHLPGIRAELSEIQKVMQDECNLYDVLYPDIEDVLDMEEPLPPDDMQTWEADVVYGGPNWSGDELIPDEPEYI